MYQQDLVTLIVSAQHGALAPYQYANLFKDKIPEHLIPSEAEKEVLRSNGGGPLQSKNAGKFSRKIFQLFSERRSVAAHLFYTPDHCHWHLFYFDNKDTENFRNHWKHGSHIHYVSDLWPELNLACTWTKIAKGEMTFANKLHLRFEKEKFRSLQRLEQSKSCEASRRPQG